MLCCFSRSSIKKGHFIGRTEYGSVEVDNEVLIDASKHYCRVGDFVNVKVTEATEFDLYAEVEEKNRFCPASGEAIQRG